MTDQQKKLHAEAIEQGYKDETCPKCNAFLPAHQHFVRCEVSPCPMKSGKSVFDMIIEQCEHEEHIQECQEQGTAIIGLA